MKQMKNEKRIFLSTPHMSGREQKYIDEAFNLNWIAPLGNNVDGFEKELANYNDIKGVAAVNSGTAAIHLALKLLGVGRGDTVFCSSLTFVASTNPIVYEGATPVLIDSEKESWNMSPRALERALKEETKNGTLPKAVIVVHLFGQSANMDAICEICDHYNVPIIEDAAESLGSEYNRQKSGTFGAFGVFSFNGNKIITTSGGGALISNNVEAIEKAKFLAQQARDPAIHYEHSEIGYNYRMSNIVAGIGRGQLEVLDDRVKERRTIFNNYKNALSHIEGVTFQPELENSKSNRWLTALTIDPDITGVTSLDLIETLEKHQIESRPVWKPMHLQPLYKNARYYPNNLDMSVSDELFKNGICLPSGSNLTKDEQERIISILLEMLKE